MDIDDLDDKPQKPKKYAEIKLTFWDDAEMDVDCIRYIKTGTGRGAAKKIIMMDKVEFLSDLDSEIMSSYGILKAIINELKIKGLTISHESDETEELEQELD